MLPSVARAQNSRVELRYPTYSLMPLYQFCRSRRLRKPAKPSPTIGLCLNGGYLQARYPNFVMMSCPEIV